MFVAGTDIDALMARTTDDSLAPFNARLFQRIEDHPWPTIAAVDGAALGGGCELALACDFRITTSEALWGLPEVTLGIIPSAGGLTRLSRLVGWGNAIDLILTGRTIDGTRAYALGMAQQVVPPGEIDPALAQLLGDLRRAVPRAARIAKEAMRITGDGDRLVDAAAQAVCIASDEAQERLQAVLDRTSMLR